MNTNEEQNSDNLSFIGEIIHQYEQLCLFLGSVFHKNHEFAVLDLRPEHMCISAISNGHNSNREVGAPITDLALTFIAENTWQKTPYVCNYTGLSNEKQLISSSFFITYQNTLIGMFCVNISSDTENFDMVYQKMNDLMKTLEIIKLEKSLTPTLSVSDSLNSSESSFTDTLTLSETFTNSIDERLEQVINQYLPIPDIPAERLTQKEKIMIVEKLNAMHLFQIKGAISKTATRLYCSEATIYRYLSKIEKK